MNNLSALQEALAKPMKESDWRAPISAIRNGNLIPMVGTDLMRVEVDGRLVTYDHVIAEELARRHGITDHDLARSGANRTLPRRSIKGDQRRLR